MTCAASRIQAQQLIGYINTHDAQITGASDTLGDQAVLTGSASVMARDHTAPITLGRGGTVRVCQTSVLHVTENRAISTAAPLLFSLDRGAVEIQMNGTPSDAIMTPDLRFTVRNSGPLDLRMRVARNGDTCVDNRGAGAPTLAVSDPFGESMYELAAGQHVLFEHGSLREVVDSESSSCGCPAEKGMSMADALIAPGSGNGPKAAVPAADVQHPFPEAVSAGLAPQEQAAVAAAAVRPPQLTDALAYYAPGVIHDPDAEGAVIPTATAPASADANGPGTPAVTSRPATAKPATNPAAKSATQGAISAAPVPVAPAKTASAPVAKPAAAPAPPPHATAAPATVSGPPPNDLVHGVGWFFRKLLGRK